jgi:hypothetical protein
MSIYQFIANNKLQPADAVELVCPNAGFPKHYAVYIGLQNDQPAFIANLFDGVRIIRDKEMLKYVARYHVASIERFNGSMGQRLSAIKKAVSRCGESAYCIVFNNCEHFKNWVLYNESTSKQVANVGLSTIATGISLCLIGGAAKNKGIQKAGLILLSILIVFVVLAFLLYNPIVNNGTSYSESRD